MAYKQENLISDDELQTRYNESLDDAHGTIEIAGLEYNTSYALLEVDPIAYRTGFNDWLDSVTGEYIFEQDGDYYSSDEEEEDNDSITYEQEPEINPDR